MRKDDMTVHDRRFIRCTRALAEILDGGAGRTLAELRELYKPEWPLVSEEAEWYMREALYDQTPCVAWYPASGLITTCVRHVSRIDPLAAWETALTRMVQDMSEDQS